MIKDVDDSDVLSGECINSPVLGQIPPGEAVRRCQDAVANAERTG